MNLILFTNHFPYSKSEQFLINEFEFAVKKFKKIKVYTFSSLSETVSIQLTADVAKSAPVFKNHKSKAELLVKGIFNLAPCKYHLRDFFENKPYTSPARLWQFFTSLLVTRAALSTDTYKSVVNMINESNDGAVLYFYWGNNLCWILPYLKDSIKNKRVKVVIRFHRTDLYEYVNNNYAPLRKFVFNAADRLVAISGDGLQYLTEKYPAFKDKITLSKLGVFDHGINPYSYSERFTLVSVSFVTPVKRVELILEALKESGKQVDWYHFGDGPMLELIKNRVKELPANINVKLMGFTKNADIMAFYKTTSVDLFINVSSSEGLPVSIMEAVSFGIPVIATDAGGTSEIVNSQTGKLLPLDITQHQLARDIDSFLSLPADSLTQYRINARRKYETELDAIANYTEFYDKIMVLN